MSTNHEISSTPAKPPIWNDPVYRGIFFQVLVLGAVVLFGLYIFNNTAENLERQGIASGFGFMNTTAGFGIITHLVEYTEESSYGRAFLVGLLNTLLVSAVGVVLATLLGLLVGIARLSKNLLVSGIATVYIEVIRNIPLLLQIFFWYFAVLRSVPAPKNSVELLDTFFLNNRGLYSPAPLPQSGFMWIVIALIVAIVAIIIMRNWARKRQDRTGQPFHTFYVSLAILIGLPALAAIVTGLPLAWEYPVLKGFNFQGGLVMIPEFVALLLALSIYTGAFIAEIVRAGILSVSHGQTEAASAVGLRNSVTLRLVVLPQALRVIIPPLTSQYLNLVKNSSLAAAIAYPELVSIFGLYSSTDSPTGC